MKMRLALTNISHEITVIMGVFKELAQILEFCRKGTPISRLS